MTKFNNENENSPEPTSSFYANDIQQFINEAKLRGNINQESLAELEKLAKNYNKKSSYNFLLRFSSLVTVLIIFIATINISLKLNNLLQFLFLLLCFVFSSIFGFVIKTKNQRIGDSLLFLGSCYMIWIFIALVAVASKIQTPYPLYQTEGVAISSLSYFNITPGIKIVKIFSLFLPLLLLPTAIFLQSEMIAAVFIASFYLAFNPFYFEESSSSLLVSGSSFILLAINSILLSGNIFSFIKDRFGLSRIIGVLFFVGTIIIVKFPLLKGDLNIVNTSPVFNKMQIMLLIANIILISRTYFSKEVSSSFPLYQKPFLVIFAIAIATYLVQAITLSNFKYSSLFIIFGGISSMIMFSFAYFLIYFGVKQSRINLIRFGVLLILIEIVTDLFIFLKENSVIIYATSILAVALIVIGLKFEKYLYSSIKNFNEKTYE
jgi:hypothetical protein